MCRGLDTNDTVIIDNEIAFVRRSLISHPQRTSCKSFHMMQMHPPCVSPAGPANIAQALEVSMHS